MRPLSRFYLTAALLPLLAAVPAHHAGAASQLRSIPEAHASGTIFAFDPGGPLLSVNTRLGLKRFLLNNRTLLLLNNHTTTLTANNVGDQVTVDYDYTTSTANTVHVFREASRSGTVVSATSSTITLRLGNGTVLTLNSNAGSVVELGGIPLTSNSVLVGRKVKAVFEPGTFLLLSLDGSSKTTKGTITSIDAEARTLVISGRNALTFDISTDATVRRAGSSAALTDLVVGDRVQVAYLRNAGTVRALAINARPGTVTPASQRHQGRKN
jgi:hypothetical protein